MKKRSAWIVAVVAGAVFLLNASGCSKGSSTIVDYPGPSSSKSLSLATYQSCSEVESEIKAMLISEMEQNLESFKYECKSDIVYTAGPAEANSGSDKSGSSDMTPTNIQEEGVDEADLIKGDGTYIYAIVGSEVRVVRAWPFTNFGQVALIKPQATPYGLYLSDKKLVVISEDQGYGFGNGVKPLSQSEPGSPPSGSSSVPSVIEEVYDVSDPSHPVLFKSQKFIGTAMDTRRTGSVIHFVMSGEAVATPDLDYSFDYSVLPDCPSSGAVVPTDSQLAEIERLKTKNRAAIESMTLAQLMPSVGQGKDVECAELVRSPTAIGKQILKIISDKFTVAGAAVQKLNMLSSGGTVYASSKALYVAAPEIDNGWWVTSPDEYKDKTVVHRFELGIDAPTPSYSGSAEIDGHLVDNSFAGSRYSSRFSMAQFAMSEFEGYLRVATTVDKSVPWVVQRGTFSTPTTDNKVTVLDTQGGKLQQSGVVGGMGTGERIRAVRFVGSRGYVVTYKKTDPLYVLDLSAPTSPVVAGELKVPGFSTYLHPFDDKRIIGLGFFTEDEESFAWTQGLKIALFDVSDPAKPGEIAHREIGSRGSYSPAVEEHHAFTLDKTRGIIALPVDIYEGGSAGNYGTHTFSGVMLLKADETGTFGTIGKIEVDSGAQDPSVPSGLYFPSTEVQRTVILGDGKDDGIVTLTSSSILLNRLDAAMTQVGKVQ